VRTFRAEPASDEIYRLGEGPVWDPVRAELLWVDIDAGEVLTGNLDDGRIRRTGRQSFGQTVGAAVRSSDGQLLVARRRDLLILGSVDASPAEGRAIELFGPDKVSRCNDGACDPAGRFLIGSMALDDRTGDDTLYRLEHDGAVTVLDDDVTLSNGLAWSPDGATMYNIDTAPGIVWARDYQPEGAMVGQRREVLRVADGSPDGMTVDTDGNLWIAIWGAGEVRCYTPDADQIATVHVGPPHTSSVTFAGVELDTLVITTASSHLDADSHSRWPDSGRVFTVRVDSRGRPATPWSPLVAAI
jgi:sugar lactone lactonase YvrE